MESFAFYLYKAGSFLQNRAEKIHPLVHKDIFIKKFNNVAGAEGAESIKYVADHFFFLSSTSKSLEDTFFLRTNGKWTKVANFQIKALKELRYAKTQMELYDAENKNK